MPKITPADYLPYAKLLEGYRSNVYLDSEGIPTIGIGFNIDTGEAVLEKMGVLDDLRKDIDDARNFASQVTDSRDYSKFSGDAKLSPENIQSLFELKATEAIDAIYGEFGSNVPDGAKGIVLVDMRYNLGAKGWAGFYAVRANIGSQSWPAVAASMMATPVYLDNPSQQTGPIYKATPWYTQTGKRGILNVQVMRGSPLPTKDLSADQLKNLDADNAKFLDNQERELFRLYCTIGEQDRQSGVSEERIRDMASRNLNYGPDPLLWRWTYPGQPLHPNQQEQPQQPQTVQTQLPQQPPRQQPQQPQEQPPQQQPQPQQPQQPPMIPYQNPGIPPPQPVIPQVLPTVEQPPVVQGKKGK